eukprot:CAMPEP_0177708028 /NCGR_PEP_ID=MMETSP0484_2-20121128/10063_1 /TAXON_ID=354590 /ORGANISM="Rhodomonas lens, Strain RHODO" /LENGTH=84 /DNA_ID=CAMNT_0019219575 /DNA_START=1040 /DNA_END=1294 /DNA_ORIENTATION=+
MIVMALPAAAPATHGLQPASEPRPGGLGMCGAAANASPVLSSGARNDSTASAAPQLCLERQAAYARNDEDAFAVPRRFLKSSRQ